MDIRKKDENSEDEVGKKDQKYVLTKIEVIDRQEIIGKYHPLKIQEMEENILYCLKELKDRSSSLEENKVYVLKFENKMLSLEIPDQD